MSTPRLHPHADLIQQRHNQRMQQQGLHRYRDQQFGWLAAAAYPDGAEEVVDLAATTLLWIFVTDDYFDDPPGDRSRHAVTALRLIRFTQDPDVHLDPSEPTQALLDDILTRLRKIATDDQVRRFTDAVAEWLTGLLGVHATPPTTPLTLSEYGLLRHFSSGLPIMFSLIDVAAGKDLRNSWRDTPLAHLVDLASAIIALDNDVVSAPKERGQHLNLPEVFATQDGVTWEEGIVRTRHYRAELLAEYHRKATRTVARSLVPDTPLVTFINGMTGWIAAHEHWSRHITSRYPGAPQ